MYIFSLQTTAEFMADTGYVRQKFPVFMIFLDRKDKALHKYHNARWTVGSTHAYKGCCHHLLAV